MKSERQRDRRSVATDTTIAIVVATVSTVVADLIVRLF